MSDTPAAIVLRDRLRTAAADAVHAVREVAQAAGHGVTAECPADFAGMIAWSYGAAPPVVSGAYASFIAYPDGHSEVAVDPQLFVGHPDIDGSAPAAGKWRFIEDLLLHEAIHDAVHRLGRDDEPPHGGTFATLAAGIGADLGLRPPPDTDWGNWPYSVRPADYYLGAFRPHAPHTGEAKHGTAPTKATDRPRKRNQARRTTSPAVARDPWPCPTSRYL